MTALRYLDHAATTPVREEALAAWLAVTREVYGNPSSHHHVGERAKAVLEDARGRIARILGARPADVVLSSGGTESNNLAVLGIARASGPDARHLVVSPIEHDSVLRCVDRLVEREGFEVSWLRPDARGIIDPAEVAAAVRDDTSLVSIGLANNEIGAVQPIAEIAAALAGRDRALPGRARLHSDAVQAAGWLPLDALGVDALTIAGHKVGAPRGIGAAVIRRRVPVEPVLYGGGHERGRRSGTEHVAGAVALAVALEYAEAERESAARAAAETRDAFLAEVRRRLPQVRLTGPESGPERLPHLASFVLDGVSGESVLLELERRGIVASSGSACAAGSDEPSHVLTAIGLHRGLAQTALRFALPHGPAAADGFAGVAEALEDAVGAVSGLRT